MTLEIKHNLLKALDFLPVRQRYILTRQNRLRFRYIASPVLAGAVIMAVSGYMRAPDMTSGQSSYHQSADFAPAVKTARYDPAAAEGEEIYEQAAYRQNQDRAVAMGADSQQDMAVHLASFAPAAGSVRHVPEPKRKSLEVGRGDTLAGLLQKAGLSGGEAYKVVAALGDLYDPRYIRAGQTVELRFDPDADGEFTFSEMKLPVDALKTVSIQRDKNNSFTSVMEEKEVEKHLRSGQAQIEVSLYGSGLKAGIPSSVISDAIKIYSWDVDFQRDIRRGDLMDVLYEQYQTAEGKTVKNGNILYIRLNVNGEDMPVYRFETKNGDVDYFTPDGRSLRKALMKTPVDGARLSSGFGMRHHPVLGYSKMHKGTDFAAPTGTPIYAAGDGTIEKIGRWSSYGNYIRLRHNATLKTAYAHMQKFAKGLSVGSRVKQGQVIGYIGTTGRSTGPHLHYEVLVNNKQVSPKTVDVPQGEILKGEQLAAFKEHMAGVQRQYARLSGETSYAALKNGRALNR